MELSEFGFDIIYRSGKLHNAPDALSRAYCVSIHDNILYDIHDALCHSGITRLYHFVGGKNLPYLIGDICRVADKCKVCCKLKPRFLKPAQQKNLMHSLSKLLNRLRNWV